MNTLSYTWSDFGASFALVIIAALMLMADAFCKRFPRRGYALIGGFSLIAVGLFFGVSGGFLSGDASQVMANIACTIAGICLLFAFDYDSVTRQSVTGSESDEGTGELYALFLIAAAGICALSQARDLITLFVSLEVVTLSSYVMVGYYRRNRGSIEAGVRYIVQGALSTGILVFGMAWYFGATGSFSLDTFVSNGQIYSIPAVQFAYILIILGILFKVGAVPMSTWIPDVYQGAPTPVTAFLSTSSKIAGVIALLAVCDTLTHALGQDSVFVGVQSALQTFLLVVAVATLLIGNIAAVTQNNAKRLLAYSSIGQAGFVLAFFATMDSEATALGSLVYLAGYALAAVAAFIVIGVIRMARQSEEVSAFNGLAKSNPYLAFAVTVIMASLAGVPLTAGFIGKFLSFFAVLETETPLVLLISMIIAAALGFYYYFKILRAMYWENAAEGEASVTVPTLSGILIGVLTVAILAMGIVLLFLAA